MTKTGCLILTLILPMWLNAEMTEPEKNKWKASFSTPAAASLAENKTELSREALDKKVKHCVTQNKVIDGRHLCSEFRLFRYMAGKDEPDSGCIYYDEEFEYTYFSLIKVLSISENGCLYYLDNSRVGVGAQNSNPIFVYKMGDPKKDLPVPDGVHPAKWQQNMHATCGGIDFPLPSGYYAYAGPYSYTTIRGDAKKIYSFKRLDIDGDCLKQN